MRKKLSTIRKVFITMLAIILISWYFIWQNNSLQITQYNYYSALLPQTFQDFKIVHISDLHNASFGENQQNLLAAIEKLQPDIIVITGDLIDRRRYDLNTAMEFIDNAVKIAPVYFVSGNHEAWSGKSEEIFSALEEAGVNIIDNKLQFIEKEGEKIYIAGLCDPAFYTEINADAEISEEAKEFMAQIPQDEFGILLSHRPELFEFYSLYHIPLIFSGHAHGGQIRLPFIGALFAPGQGLFPEYTAGGYELLDSVMYVSRGLGNSLFPIRINNRPQINCIILNQELT